MNLLRQIFVMGTLLTALGAQAETMVPYAHPVWHNGHRVLYHGTWRGGAARADEEKPKPAKVAAGAPHEFIVLVDSGDPTALRMATEVVTSLKAGGLRARAWAAKTSPAALAGFIEHDGGDFLVTALDPLTSDPKAADLRAKAPLVARLANEPLVIVAGPGVQTIADLDGKAVSFGEAEGGADILGQAVLATYGVKPKVVRQKLDDALDLVAEGKLAAVAMLGADESSDLADAAKSGKLHALALPWRDEFAGHYVPARLTERDLPRLTTGALETISIPFALFAVDAPEGSARAKQDGPFVTALFERARNLQTPGQDLKWRDVNLAADANWPRAAPARDWLEKRKSDMDSSLEVFRQIAKGETDPANADKLYSSVMRMGGAQP